MSIFSLVQTCAEDSILQCVPLTCTIIGLQGGSAGQARVDIMGFIDHRYFAVSIVLK